MIKHYIAIALMLLPVGLYAQVDLHIQAGGGYPWEKRDDYIDNKNLFTVRPQVGIDINVHISPILSFETGLDFNIKGYRNKYAEAVMDTTVLTQPDTSIITKWRFDIIRKEQLAYINIPLMLYGKVYMYRNNAFFVGFGMNYGFLLNAYHIITNDTYVNNTYKGTNTQKVKLKSGLIEASDNVYYVNVFDAGLKLDVRYVYHKRYTADICYEYSLYRNASGNYGFIDKNRYIGFSFGYIIHCREHS